MTGGELQARLPIPRLPSDPDDAHPRLGEEERDTAVVLEEVFQISAVFYPTPTQLALRSEEEPGGRWT
jgi:hypothetical protein